jgi:hypothetical protein
MDEIESDTQSFILKVWVEDHAEKTGRRAWRSHITHVSSNKRRYLNNLSGIEDFVLPYLEEMGVKLGMRWRIRRWLNRLLG